jgi:hypothetical protein
MWQYCFREAPGDVWTSGPNPDPVHLGTIEELQPALDWAHIRLCLLKPYFETENYPLVDARDLLPSFDTDFYEYKELPGFSMVVLERHLSPMNEIFQYDALHPMLDWRLEEDVAGEACVLETDVIRRNRETFLSRLPKRFHDDFLKDFDHADISALEHYHDLIPYLLHLERAHVLALDSQGGFHLAGVYSSLPSDLDAELKRFGTRIGKFRPGDNLRYECNRTFVYQFLMELCGFPIVSERRTSAAMFARKLHRMGEKFLVRVLGQSDRIITTLSTPRARRPYPRVEKLALVQVPADQKETIQILKEQGFFVDIRRRVVILRVLYEQHRFNPKNVQEDRALSVRGQEIIHPVTGRVLDTFDILKQPRSMVLVLNDIVRGEHRGSVIYKRNERIDGTETHEQRLKFLYTWLSKHQRRIIAYSDEFYSKIVKVLDSYLLAPELVEIFHSMRDLHREVFEKFSYIQQARMANVLHDLAARKYRGADISYREMLTLLVEHMGEIRYLIINFHGKLARMILDIGNRVLRDGYLRRAYVEVDAAALSEYGRAVRQGYLEFEALLRDMEQIVAQAQATVVEEDLPVF